MQFLDKLSSIQASHNSLLCVGLDPDPQLLPKHLQSLPLNDALLAFNTAIIEATFSLCCAYKMNLAFYEAWGSAGLRVLERTLLRIPPTCITIADGKRGDIGNSARMYASSVFEYFHFDACTVNPYMGRDSIDPFLQYHDKAAFVLGLTSNPGARDFELQTVEGYPLHSLISKRVLEWQKDAPGTAGLVMGANHPDEMGKVRSQLSPTIPILVPGVGAQGGDLNEIFFALGKDHGPVLINSSRQIIYASASRDFEEAAHDNANQTRELINAARSS